VRKHIGKLHDSDLVKAMSLVYSVPGDIAEIGVFKGELFNRLCGFAEARGCIAHAFDSFVGMEDPTGNDDGYYQRGRFNIGGPRAFVTFMDSYKVDRDRYAVHPGFIPDCFATARSLSFAFVYVDVDHYYPTLVSALWAFSHLRPGGVVGFDDYFSDGPSRLASRAIKQVLAMSNLDIVLETDNHQLFVRTGA